MQYLSPPNFRPTRFPNPIFSLQAILKKKKKKKKKKIGLSRILPTSIFSLWVSKKIGTLQNPASPNLLLTGNSKKKKKKKKIGLSRILPTSIFSLWAFPKNLALPKISPTTSLYGQLKLFGYVCRANLEKFKPMPSKIEAVTSTAQLLTFSKWQSLYGG